MSSQDRRFDRKSDSPRRKKSQSPVLFWALGLGGVCVFFGLACCGGLAYFGFHVMATEVELAIRDNVQIREHLGDLQSVRLNVVKSMVDDNDETWVYDLTGSKGKGELTVKQMTDANGDEKFHSAKLRLADGQTFDLELSAKGN